MRKEFKAKLNGDETRKDASAAFTLPFDTRDVWGKAKVPVKVMINGYTWRSTIGNRGGQQYIVVNAEARRSGGVKAGDVVTIAIEPDTEKREVEIPAPRFAQKASGVPKAKPTQTIHSTSRCTMRITSLRVAQTGKVPPCQNQLGVCG
jgi:hypothetical protein